MNRLRFSALVLALVVGISVAAVSSALATRSAPAQAHKAALITIKVTAGDFFFRLSTKSVKGPATVLFVVKNAGQIPHDFEITSLGRKTPLITSGHRASLRVVFKHRGRYQYICTVPRHAEQGMTGTFIVR
jgi:uncharacterized cupredoxin-like copper-binding protein